MGRGRQAHTHWARVTVPTFICSLRRLVSLECEGHTPYLCSCFTHPLTKQVLLPEPLLLWEGGEVEQGWPQPVEVTRWQGCLDTWLSADHQGCFCRLEVALKAELSQV
jgi:hypothetical protein